LNISYFSASQSYNCLFKRVSSSDCLGEPTSSSIISEVFDIPEFIFRSSSSYHCWTMNSNCLIYFFSEAFYTAQSFVICLIRLSYTSRSQPTLGFGLWLDITSLGLYNTLFTPRWLIYECSYFSGVATKPRWLRSGRLIIVSLVNSPYISLREILTRRLLSVRRLGLILCSCSFENEGIGFICGYSMLKELEPWLLLWGSSSNR